MTKRKLQRGAKTVAAIVTVVVAIIAAGGGYWFGMRRASEPASAVATQTVPTADTKGGQIDPKTGRKVLYWQDPMVPGQKFDKPGKSPFMDMDLVPVYADEAADEGKVSISPRFAQSFGVRTVEAKEGTLATGFTAVGAVAVDERTIVGVQSRVQGYVEKLHVRATFENVAAGQPLAQIYAPEWLAAQEELLALKGSTQPGAAPLVDAARHRLKLLGMPEAEIVRVEREGRVSDRVTIAAPQGGIVWEIGARDGMAVMPGTTLYRIAGLGSVWVIAEVPEAQAGLVKVGAPVEARAAAYPDRVFKGTVGTLLPEVNTVTRTLRARIVLGNPGGVLKPGMFASVAFAGDKGRANVLVPSEAVIRTGTRAVAIVDAGNGRFAPVEVEVGRESGELTEIRKGLKAGDKVVASGQFLIDSEASLRGVLARMNTDEAPGSGQGTSQGVIRHKAVGVVRDIDVGEVTIQHDPIPSAGMGAMTMGYKVPASGVPKDVKEGTKVDFEFTLTPKGEYQLTAIAPAKGGPLVPAKVGAAVPADPHAGHAAPGAPR
jgi:membrane fusion protein, copper/silver efflux system